MEVEEEEEEEEGEGEGEEGGRKEEEEEEEEGREERWTLRCLLFRMLHDWVRCIRCWMRIYLCVSPCFLLLLLLLLLLRVRE